MRCRLCHSEQTTLFHQSEDRDYYLCGECDLVFVPSEFFVNQSDEKAKYDNHQNSIENEGYCQFLDRLLLPMQALLKPKAKGLDFGSGPGPTLHQLMQKRGFKMDIYDIFYHNDLSVFTKRYDFITSTEVIEHLHRPLFEIERLWGMLNDDGVLGLMTGFRPDDFASWYYKRDLTHINFFTPKTFAWLAQKLEAELTIPCEGVVILGKGYNTHGWA